MTTDPDLKGLGEAGQVALRQAQYKHCRTPAQAEMKVKI